MIIKPLRIMFPKVRAYVKYYDGKTKWVCFLFEDDEILKEWNNIWDEVRNDMKKQLMVNTSTIKNRENQNKKNNEVTNFHDEEMPKVGSNYIWLVVILIDFVVQKDEKLLSTNFFKVMDIHWERKNVIRYITNDLEIFPLDFSK